MKGLFLKDFYMMKKYCRYYLLIMLIFLLVSVFSDNNFFFILYPVILSSMIPVTLISYDEKSKWNFYADTLPVSRKQLVSVKYMMMLILLGTGILLIGVIQFGRMLYFQNFSVETLVLLTGILLIAGTLSSSLLLPVIFKMGVEKGRLAYYLVLGVICAVFAGMGVLTSKESVQNVFLPSVKTVWIIAGGAVLLFIFSWFLSVRFYQKREL